jgi:GxxExxY protein
MAEFSAAAINELSGTIIGCCIEVHRHLGPGLLERTYQGCLEYELRAAGLRIDRDSRVPIVYKGIAMGTYAVDLLVEGLVVLAQRLIFPVPRRRLDAC